MQLRNPRSSIARAHKSSVATEIILEVEGIPGSLPSPENLLLPVRRQGSPEHIYCLVPTGNRWERVLEAKPRGDISKTARAPRLVPEAEPQGIRQKRWMRYNIRKATSVLARWPNHEYTIRTVVRTGSYREIAIG